MGEFERQIFLEEKFKTLQSWNLNLLQMLFDEAKKEFYDILNNSSESVSSKSVDGLIKAYSIISQFIQFGEKWFGDVD